MTPQKEIEYKVFFKNKKIMYITHKEFIPFCLELVDTINWDNTVTRQNLPEDVLREFHEHLDWRYVSITDNLSENFIRDHRDLLDWRHISRNQTLSEDFIREHQDYVHWTFISAKQTLSEAFLDEFEPRLNKSAIETHQHIFLEFAIKKNWNIQKIFETNQTLSKELRKKYGKYLEIKKALS